MANNTRNGNGNAGKRDKSAKLVALEATDGLIQSFWMASTSAPEEWKNAVRCAAFHDLADKIYAAVSEYWAKYNRCETAAYGRA